MAPTCIEVAVNGHWTRKRQAVIPISADDIVAESVACARAGASIVHFHAYDVESDEQSVDLDLVSSIVRRIREQVDVIIYPAIRYVENPISIKSGAGLTRYEHLKKLAEEGLGEWLIVDPGSTNMVQYDDISLTKTSIDINAADSVNYGLAVAAETGLHPTMAIYEPAYLRLGGLLASRTPGLKAPMYRFVFSDQFTFGFPPRLYALDAYLALRTELKINAPWMAAGLGVDVFPLIDDVVQRGGHIRVGLEDFLLGTTRTNLDLVEEAAARIARAGGRVADVGEARALMSAATI